MFLVASLRLYRLSAVKSSLTKNLAHSLSDDGLLFLQENRPFATTLPDIEQIANKFICLVSLNKKIPFSHPGGAGAAARRNASHQDRLLDNSRGRNRESSKILRDPQDVKTTFTSCLPERTTPKINLYIRWRSGSRQASQEYPPERNDRDNLPALFFSADRSTHSLVRLR